MLIADYEVWKNISIKDYEDFYQVSNLGRVRSVDKVDSLGRLIRGKIKASTNNGNGYLVVNLKNNGKQKMVTIHRLVAEAFIPNPYNLPQINHKDENKLNNKVENLEWCDAKYNNSYGTAHIRSAMAHINHPNMSKKVICVETGIIYPSIAEAERQLGVRSSNIVVCGQHRKTKNSWWLSLGIY